VLDRATEGQALPVKAKLVDALTARLAADGVRYCHWKSNFSLDNALAGREDLDLLVDRVHLSAMLRVLLELGFKGARAFGLNQPGIHHYYGLDPDSGMLIHVHLFSRLLTGESLVKSHQLPLASLLLDSARSENGIQVASRTAELAGFVLRTFIKYGSPLDVLMLLRSRASFAKELAWLKQDADTAAAADAIQESVPQIDRALFQECLSSLEQNASWPRRYWLARRVRRRLRIHAAHTPWGRGRAYAQWFRWLIFRRFTGKKDKALVAGGAVIAFVGPEATGKSTLLEESRAWLASAFAVSSVHAGKPPAGWFTWPVSLALPYLRKFFPRLRTSRVEGHLIGPGESAAASIPRAGLAGLAYALRVLSLAWDRRSLLIRVKRAAGSGQFVICDRYPSLVVGAMDSPRLDEGQARGALAPLLRRFARWEAKLYQEMPAPDLVLRLRVSLETAQKRNKERVKLEKEGEEYLASRHRQASLWQRPGVVVIDVDTERSLLETIRLVKQSIWGAL